MAGRGAPPKARRSRDRDTRPTHQSSGRPSSGPSLPDAEGYSEATRRWYGVWATSQQAELFTVTDWQRLHMLAPLIDAYFAQPSKDLMAEIRINEAKLGATAEDRQRLRWEFELPVDRPVMTSSRGREDPRRLSILEG